MPFKLIGTIILLIIVTVFAGVNMDNKCNINFVFRIFEQVPVFITVIVSFAAGAIVMLPFTLGIGRKKKADKKEKASKPETKPLAQNSEDASTESKTLFDFKIKKDTSKSEKTSFFGKKKDKSAAKKSGGDTVSDNSDSTVAPSN